MSAAVSEAGELPRVLVVTSNNFNMQSGGGIMLNNLFRGWPADRLANLHEDATPPDTSVCARSFRLTRAEAPWSGAFGLLERWNPSSTSPSETRALASPAPGRSWKRQLVGDGVPRDGVISPALAAWVDEFRPGLVYGFLGSTTQIRLVHRIAARWNTAAAIHIMDDWPAVIYTEGLLGPLLRPMILREFREVLGEAKVRMAISDAMAAEYERRYGLPFVAFQNALNLAEWLPGSRTTWQSEEPVVVRYVGSMLAEAQRSAFRDVCEAVAELRGEGVDITVSVHSPARQTEALRAWGFPEDVLQVASSPAPDHVPALLGSASVLLLPFNFDAPSVQYIRLSMPTKVPAYMVSGTPVLAYGPVGVAAIDYAQREKWAETVTTQSRADLKAALRVLATDPQRREALGRRAMAVARERHDVVKVRAAFWQALQSAMTS